MEAASALWNCSCKRVTLRATLKKSIASQVQASHLLLTSVSVVVTIRKDRTQSEIVPIGRQ
jgi:hypothetical protein